MMLQIGDDVPRSTHTDDGNDRDRKRVGDVTGESSCDGCAMAESRVGYRGHTGYRAGGEMELIAHADSKVTVAAGDGSVQIADHAKSGRDTAFDRHSFDLARGACHRAD